MDLFEPIWAVDRLERLGISRYFQQEIEECMDYVNRFFFVTFQTIFYLKMQRGKTQLLHCMSNDLLLHNKYINPFYRHFTEEGICWARNSDVKEVDDTAMAFRLLRLHGYSVSPGKKAKQIIFVHVLLNHFTFFSHILHL